MSITEVDWNECILWDGPLHNGYAIRNRNGKREQMSRVIMEEETGKPLPLGSVVRHKCDNPACVAPDHLLLGTQADNVADMDRRGRARRGADNKAKTHCPQGHPYIGENCAIDNRGRRHCIACRRARKKRWDAANRDKVLARQKAYRTRKRLSEEEQVKT